jgi:hypothetical protein
MQDYIESENDRTNDFCNSGNELLDKSRKVSVYMGGGEYYIQDSNMQDNSELRNIFL